MKLTNLIFLLAPLMVVVSAAADDAALYDFAYDFLAPNHIVPCSGVKPRVLNVAVIGATNSGGGGGSDEEWSKAQLSGPQTYHTQTRYTHRGHEGDIAETYEVPDYPPKRNVEAELSGGLQGYDLNTLAYDKSLVRSIDHAILMMEKLPLRSAKISICLSQIDLANVTQSHAAGTVVDWALAFKVYLNVNVSSQVRSQFLVQELHGNLQTRAPFWHMYYDFSPRAALLLQQGWPQIANRFDAVRAVPNAEADDNLESVKAELSEYLGSGPI